ncbi:hypothetical protein ACQR35_09250 [Pseudarthrobacter sp. J1738]|uniref:hypothetical protein n=1 Tax=unclassified Pseudarthrobacter TaxID=2647000 RepID=UPI003D27C72D
MTAPAAHAARPPLALLLDVDGPVASPETRQVKPEIISELIALATAGVPVIFNTGRSDSFIKEQVMTPMLAAGIPEGVTIHAICEKGAVWFSFDSKGDSQIQVDRELAVPAAYAQSVLELVEREFTDHMFYDHTKHAMVSVEQRTDVSNKDYLAVQGAFDQKALELMGQHGLSATILDHTKSASVAELRSDDGPDFQLDPTIISTDIESVHLGKDLGASRAVELLTAAGIAPLAWRTVGDSRTDYAMADWLHHHNHEVKHVDVRPADGVPEKPYQVLTASDLGLGPEVIHDHAGGAFLRRWREEFAG